MTTAALTQPRLGGVLFFRLMVESVWDDTARNSICSQRTVALKRPSGTVSNRNWPD